MRTKVIVMGDEKVGKTSIIHRLCFPLDMPRVSKTIGIDCTSRVIGFNNIIYNVQFWDVAGGVQWLPLYPKYIKNADLAVVVYDVSNENSFVNLKKWIGVIRKENGDKFPIVIIANKIDKESSRVVHTERHKIYEKQFNLDVFLIEMSALKGINLQHSLKCILSLIKPKKVLTTTVHQKTWYEKWFG
ncbi:MAG: hypothetical protein CMF41_07015 [Legionellales bacterium]|nr:hypothetical protein [Legionellales bacterium]OUX63546.1 MAG: hypothetical protein CBE41_04635 [Gammaproteobacteria bacterium TMED281]|tara:strand:- start:2347 stop:2907 length:561 start_codon:yes stop_codon:yes gene_type:complete